jgi:PKD repeat protein
LTPVEGGTFSAHVATFSDGNPNGTLSDYSATISWGDNASSPGAISPDGQGGYIVSGSHMYAEEGSYNVTVTITDDGGSTTSATTLAAVADATISASGTQLSEKHDVTFKATIATLTDADPGGAAADYSGSIGWGDGTTTACPSSVCSFVRQANGSFALSASHKYSKKGRYTVTINLKDAGGATTQATTIITAS